MKAYYHNQCGWVFEQDGDGVVLPNQCPTCGKGPLWFFHSDSSQALKKALRERGLPVPEWLTQVIAKETSEATKEAMRDSQVP